MLTCMDRVSKSAVVRKSLDYMEQPDSQSFKIALPLRSQPLISPVKDELNRMMVIDLLGSTSASVVINIGDRDPSWGK